MKNSMNRKMYKMVDGEYRRAMRDAGYQEHGCESDDCAECCTKCNTTISISIEATRYLVAIYAVRGVYRNNILAHRMTGRVSVRDRWHRYLLHIPMWRDRHSFKNTGRHNFLRPKDGFVDLTVKEVYNRYK